MASLIFAAGAFTYDKVQKSREKKRAAREDRSLRYSELEKDHAEYITRREICVCEREGWDGKTHREGCARARGTTKGGEERDERGLIDAGDEGNFAVVDEKRSEEMGATATPPSYESLEVEQKGKSGIFGRKARKEEQIVR